MRVKVDVKRQKAKFDRTDPRLDPNDAVPARLQELATLRTQGRITDAQYEYFREGIRNGSVAIDGRRYGPIDSEGE